MRRAPGAASGGIEEKASEELAKRATDLLAAYGTGDAEALGKALGSFEGELEKKAEEGKVSTDAAAAIDLATLELVQALKEEGALSVASPSPEPTVVEEGNEDEGKGEQGPPAHANNDKDED